MPTSLREISIERLDVGQYPERNKTDKLRSELMQRDGISERAILEENANRLSRTTPQPGLRITPEPAASANEQLAPAAKEAGSPATRDEPVAEVISELSKESPMLVPLRPRPRKPPKRTNKPATTGQG